MTSIKWTIFAAVLAILMLPLSSTAWAQETFSTSSPAEGAVLKTAPTFFTIEFTEVIDLRSVRLMRVDGTEWPTDWAKNEKRVLDAKFRSIKPLPPGNYTIEWAAVVHSHDDSGVIKFSIVP